MPCTEFLKARVTPEIKIQAKAIADRELLSEASWLKRLVLKEIRQAEPNRSGEGDPPAAAGLGRQKRVANRGGCGGKPMLVRLRNEDRLLLDARAEARGMRPATYASDLPADFRSS